ncbi:hypothetical protein HELRODRAFT_113547 [Helobdella robusta]|uniref:G-protein coupled receptors family 1 profile domain-containing protein n=1 Tax=Helobdella robusta TaxID=6412 RepID=T1EFT4_HELRO|nr:hypothetical protein HELRODRAFT_113547 [Helobdella robusta]ESN99759.1 hypothetical protein HELRODRAFT_113547 [Helobdella robusta]
MQVLGQWPLGFSACLAWTGLDVILSTSSIMHLCAIAIYRYRGIAHPLHTRSSSRKFSLVAALVVPAWVVSVALSIPFIVQATLHESYVLKSIEKTHCGIFNHTFAVYSSLVSFFIPLTIMVFADIGSIKILRENVLARHDLKKTKSLKILGDNLKVKQQNFREKFFPKKPLPMNSKIKNNSFEVASIGTLIRSAHVSGREKRAEKTLIWVFLAFVALWLPFFCANLSYGICGLSNSAADSSPIYCNVPPEIITIFTWLGYLSSGVNPCIYTLLNKDFRNAFKNILLCKSGRPSKTHNRQKNYLPGDARNLRRTNDSNANKPSNLSKEYNSADK